MKNGIHSILFSSAVGLIVSLFLFGTMKIAQSAESRAVVNERDIAVIREHNKSVLMLIQRIDKKLDIVMAKIYE